MISKLLEINPSIDRKKLQVDPSLFKVESLISDLLVKKKGQILPGKLKVSKHLNQPLEVEKAKLRLV